MKNTLFLLILLLFFACETKQEATEEQTVESVTKAWKELYQHYENSDLHFIDFYQDDVIRMGTDGMYKVGKEVFRKGWEEYYQKNHVEVLDYSQPTVLPSKEQTVTFNTYKEIFISKETLDTTFVEGTWIAVWKKQDDGSWKIRMSTWHN